MSTPPTDVPPEVSRTCLHGHPCPPSLSRLWNLSARGALPEASGIARLLTSLDALEAGYGDAIASEGPDVAANVRAHRRVFARLGFFAEADDGALWAFDLDANVGEPPVVALDTGGQYSWLGVDLAQVLAHDERAASVATQFLPDLGDLHRGYYAEETGAPRPPRALATSPAIVSDPESWLLRPAAEVRALLGDTLPAEPVVRCNDDGRVKTVWLPAQGPLAALSVRGVTLGADVAGVRARLGEPTKERAAWMRYEGAGRALHFQTSDGVVTRITLMTLDAAP